MTANTDLINAAMLAARIDARHAATPDARGLIGRRVEHHARIDSTSDRARAIAASGEPEGTVVIAEEQTAGRGRAERQWHSPRGPGLYLSVILRPQAAPSDAPMFGLMAAVALREALQHLSGHPIRIKWPNDLIIDYDGGRRKLAGILAEARTGSEAIRDLVIGVGVNVNHEAEDFPLELITRSTSLRLLQGSRFARVDVAAEILTRLDVWYTYWNRFGNAPVLTAYIENAVDLVGRAVRVVSGTGPDGARVLATGTTSGIGVDGALRVVPDDGGETLVVRYGEVVRLEEP